MGDCVDNFLAAADALAAAFECGTEFPFRVCAGEKWRLSEAGGSFFLGLESPEDGKTRAFAVAKAGGEPMLFEYSRYTMVVAIDCIKTAFILENKNNTN